jgi:hypothetical protein
MRLTSKDFAEGEVLPLKYSVDGLAYSPPLTWQEVPEGTKSLALIMEAPEKPGGIRVHWIVYNLPPDLSELAENLPTTGDLPNGAVQGVNDFQKVGYGPPAPPRGFRRAYVFKLYALDTLLDKNLNEPQLLKAMQGHILAETELKTVFSR